MSNYSAKSLFIICLLTLSACSDPCDSALCLNNGTCVDGECECAFLYFGENCENEASTTSTAMFWTNDTLYSEESGWPAIKLFVDGELRSNQIDIPSYYLSEDCGFVAGESYGVQGYLMYELTWSPEMSVPHVFDWQVTDEDGIVIHDSGTDSLELNECFSIDFEYW